MSEEVVVSTSSPELWPEVCPEPTFRASDLQQGKYSRKTGIRKETHTKKRKERTKNEGYKS